MWGGANAKWEIKKFVMLLSRQRIRRPTSLPLDSRIYKKNIDSRICLLKSTIVIYSNSARSVGSRLTAICGCCPTCDVGPSGRVVAEPCPQLNGHLAALCRHRLEEVRRRAKRCHTTAWPTESMSHVRFYVHLKHLAIGALNFLSVLLDIKISMGVHFLSQHA